MLVDLVINDYYEEELMYYQLLVGDQSKVPSMRIVIMRVSKEIGGVRQSKYTQSSIDE